MLCPNLPLKPSQIWDIIRSITNFSSQLFYSFVHLLNMTDGLAARPQNIKLQRKQMTPNDIKVFEPIRQDPNGYSPCAKENGGCSDLCLAASNSRGFSCACPTGFSLSEDFDGEYYHTCSTKFNEVLLVATTQGLSKISLDLPDLSDTVIPIYNNISKYYTREPNIVAVDYDPISMYTTKNNFVKSILRKNISKD